MHVPNQTFARIQEVSQTMGIEENSFVHRAILFYIDAVQTQLTFSQEMNAWDKLSDEALRNFEAAL